MHEAEFDQKGQEENIWEKVLEEFGFVGDGEFVASLETRARMTKRVRELREEQSS